MKSEYVPYIIGSVTTIIGIVLSYFLGKRSALKIHDKQRRQAPCEKFRMAIAQEISLWHRLANSPSMFVGKLANHLPELQNSPIIAALIEFRTFVSKKAEEYGNTCEAYNNYKKKALTEPWGSPGSHPAAIKLLDALLSYADE